VPIGNVVANLNNRDRDGNASIGAPNRPDLYPELEPILKGCTVSELLLHESGKR